MKCPHCGFNAESYPFCPICGTRLAQAQPDPPPMRREPVPPDGNEPPSLPKNRNKALLVAAILIASVIISGMLVAALSRAFYNRSIFDAGEAAVTYALTEEQTKDR